MPDESEKFERIKTYVSGVFWYDPRSEIDGTLPFVPAREINNTADDPREIDIHWLDRLFGDGILLPKPVAAGEQSRALTMVISGPPGSGKSTLAMELCYRFATTNPGLNSVYFAIDGYAPWLRDNGKRLWGKPYTDQVDCGQIELYQYPASEAARAGAPPAPPGIISTVVDFLRGLSSDSRPADEEPFPRQPVAEEIKKYGVVVIDSLDVIPSATGKARLFEAWMSIIDKGPRLFIFILDSNHRRNQENHEFWEYICDVAIRMDRTSPTNAADGYMVRTLEIVKARYQQHAWGPQQIKLYEAHDHTQLNSQQRRRAYPFRSEGGVFIYPSIHYLLSIYKRSDPSDLPIWAATPLHGLNILLGSHRFASPATPPGEAGARDGILAEADRGFPDGRCTALVGGRGGHKSRIAVLHIVFRILEFSESGIIVSLRDDVPIVLTMIEDILSTMPNDQAETARDKLARYLDIVYFAPGNITPEEFLHRILLSVLRLKALGRELAQYRAAAGESKSRQKITLLFNSVDGLAPRFPMCAREPLFLAALVHVLSSHLVTSILVGATDSGKTDEYLGLYAIAELIINFSHCTLSKDDVDSITTAILEQAEFEHKAWQRAGNGLARPARPVREASAAIVEHWLRNNLTEPHVIVQILRHAGSHPSGSRALVFLIDQEHPLANIFPRPGLYCVPVKWSPTERARGNENA
jgi:KaiC/GvpD/RAD55 family RecA-like ATPase